MTSRRDFLALCASVFSGSPWAPPRERLQAEELLEVLGFHDEGNHPLDRLIGSGLDGRRALDLSRLTPSELIVPNQRFFVRTACPDTLPSTENWRIEIRGLVSAPRELDLERDVVRLARPMGVHLIECAGNGRDGHFGLISAAEWHGVPISSILDRLSVRDGATAALISGYDRHPGVASSVPGADWIFSLDQLEDSGAFLATSMNDAPLSRHHGYPVRLVVPGWYGCCCIKWVNHIELVDDTAPATGHMKEFAGRTNQDAYGPLDLLVSQRQESFGPKWAKDFKPAFIDAAALPVRVEKWRSETGLEYRIVGVLWGGERPTESLVIRCQRGDDYEPVEHYRQDSTRTWTLWEHTFRPESPGRYRIQLRIADSSESSRRLGSGYYDRDVVISDA